MTDSVQQDGSTDQAVTATSQHVTMQKTPFHFKTDKPVVVKDAATGEVVSTTPGKKHPSVEVHLPVPKDSRIVEIMGATTGFEKEKDLIRQAIASVVFGVARGQINDFREKNPEGVVTPAVLNYDKLDLTAIANMPKSERGSFVPADEDIKTFLDSYLELMPAITNKSPEKIKVHVDIISTGFKKQRAQKDMLEFFRDAIGTYVLNAPEEVVDEHSEVVEYFMSRLERMLKVEERITMDDL